MVLCVKYFKISNINKIICHFNDNIRIERFLKTIKTYLYLITYEEKYTVLLQFIFVNHLNHDKLREKISVYSSKPEIISSVLREKRGDLLWFHSYCVYK